ncbi:hypothetical protein [Streptomyces sp. NPDC058145]|uniref:hypothetical protein n=1 Tax=Streptomyces sp. NPDC058145 TaxID=3346356 RepID=UPI0036EA6DA1
MANPDPTTPGPAAGADVLGQNLTDALNAVAGAGQFPHFHNPYGPNNDRQHQPDTTSTHANAPWAVYHLATGKFTVSNRERTLSGEHPQRPRRPRRSRR